MQVFQAIVLGLVQGFTEFLPVSSSGHLVIFERLFPNLKFSGALFETVLHAGTLLSVVIFFWKKIIKLDFKYILAILVGTIPAGIVGILFSSQIEGLFKNIKLVGIALMVTGVFNLLSDKGNPEKKKVDLKDALLIGTAQAFAIIPGVSRSGSTIFWGVLKGVDRKTAAEFSFLLSVPAILGANLVEIYRFKNTLTDGNFLTLAVGFFAAFFSGFFAIRMVISLLSKRRFKFFAFYCFVLGILTLLVL